MTETRTQSGGGDPPMLTLPSPRTTIGASARIGIVCDATTYGMIPRRSTSNWARITPSTNPMTAPKRNPTAAARAVKSAACRRYSHRSSPVDVGSPSWSTMSWRCGSV